MKLAVCEVGGPPDGDLFKYMFDSVYPLPHADKLEPNSCVLLWGGTDISPLLYGEQANAFCEAGNAPSKRDQIEWAIVRRALELDCPIIGVCRGAQLLCAFDGGSLAQHVEGHEDGHIIVDKDENMVYAPANHHQMMIPREGNDLLFWGYKRRTNHYIGENDTINVFPDNWREPEIVWFPRLKALGIQPHPEWGGWSHPIAKLTTKLVRTYITERMESFV